ncbi:hypothetical protein FACS18942_09140 [Planctomycetales bacterium]|nr:hypothetical protein FACS18942_09140 [Planctomycetales bacterium]GHT35810.1 hypothetical protein FACS189427_06000 [Planctomycetales bacterium]
MQEQKKVVLIIEDLDRNEGADFQLDNILATLRRLRETKNISFILTGFYQSIEKDKQDDKSENRIKDFTKICDYVVDVSDIAYNEKFNLLSEIAEFHEKKKYPDDITISSRRQDESLTTTSETDNRVLTDETSVLPLPQTFGRELYAYTDIFPSVALCSLIDTPRMLKMVIRDIDVSWDKLHGEIDYKNLLAMVILRNTDNPLMYFIRELQAEFNPSKEFTQLQTDFIDWATSQYNPVLQKKQKNAYNRILNWCFKSRLAIDFTKIDNDHVLPEDSDQKQLRAIYDWNEKKETPIVDRILETNNFNYEKTMRWLGYVKDDTLLDLTKKVIFRLITENDKEKIFYPLYLLSRQWHLGFDRAKQKSYPRICGSVERSNETAKLLSQWFDDVFREILKTGQKNLNLCAEVLYHFGKFHEESHNGTIYSFGLYDDILTKEERDSCKGDESKAKNISENKVLDVLKKLVENEIISQEEFNTVKQSAYSVNK